MPSMVSGVGYYENKMEAELGRGAIHLTKHGGLATTVAFDRLAGRWDRFSWFGFYPVTEDAKLNLNVKFKDFTIQNLGDILEAILIESIEPRQNRKQGNSFVV